MTEEQEQISKKAVSELSEIIYENAKYHANGIQCVLLAKHILEAGYVHQREILSRVSINAKALDEIIKAYEKNRLAAGYEASYRYRGTEFSMLINLPENKAKIIRFKEDKSDAGN